jgi:hypothetical protein
MEQSDPCQQERGIHVIQRPEEENHRLSPEPPESTNLSYHTILAELSLLHHDDIVIGIDCLRPGAAFRGVIIPWDYKDTVLSVH